jgi:hypothetical protein
MALFIIAAYLQQEVLCGQSVAIDTINQLIALTRLQPQYQFILIPGCYSPTWPRLKAGVPARWPTI